MVVSSRGSFQRNDLDAVTDFFAHKYCSVTPVKSGQDYTQKTSVEVWLEIYLAKTPGYKPKNNDVTNFF